MNRSRMFWSTTLVCVFAGIASMAYADTDNNNDFSRKVKEKTQRAVEWTEERCKAAKEKLDEMRAKGSVKWQEFTDKVETRFGSSISKKREENNPQPTRPVIDEPKETIDLKVPFEVPAQAKPTGSEPIKRGKPVTTKEEIGGQKVEVASFDLPNDVDWFAWLETEEGRKFALGAIAVITVCGVTYILYKNRVPQRIYGYAVKNPIKSLVSTACVAGIVAYIAHQNGVTIDSIKQKFCLPSTQP